MEPNNSQFHMYVDLVSDLLRQDPLHTTPAKSIQRDLLTLRERSTHEGLSFITKTLPKLGKALDDGLVTTKFTLPREFKSSHGNGSIPAFMQVYFNLVFDESGSLRDRAEPAAVIHLRQVLFFGYKLELPYQPSDEAGVIQNFIATEEDLELAVGEDAAATIAAASYILRSVFKGFDPKDILPRHGPGAVATGERLDEKWEFSRLYSSIHQVYPYYDYFMIGSRDNLIDRRTWYKSLERLNSGRAKVVLVPKDSRGPRLISCEPLEYQWIQQGLGRKMMAHLESSRITKGHVNFTDQQVNRRLAQSSSIDGTYATLDLKDASDRVSLELVKRLFATTSLLPYLEGTRTSATMLPDGSILNLKKFAPMGSALCFPVEACVFYSLIVATISRATSKPPELVGRDVYVYGDDIIVPTEHAHLVMQSLQRFGLRFNPKKCCITGSFRESCGMDAFKGVDVTPSRLRKIWTGRRTDGTAYSSYVSLANSLESKGYLLAAGRIWKELEKVYGTIPYGLPTSPFPCRYTQNMQQAIASNRGTLRMRWSSHLQRVEVFVNRLSNRMAKCTLDSWERLFRGVITSYRDSDPSINVLPRSLRIKRGWSPI